MRFELVGVPYTSMAEPGGIARAIELALAEGDGLRGPSGFLNEAALSRLVVASREAVASSRERHRLPLLIGGDCPVLLGALAAARDRHGTCGLVLVDGHEDAWPPSLSPTGEASDSEVGVALGLVDEALPEPLDLLTPLLAPEAVAMLGPRDRAEIDAQGVSSLDGTVAGFRDDEAVRAHGPSASAHEAVAAVGLAAPVFWLHLDLDVLSTDELAAVDYPQAGGLTWQELNEIGAAVLTAPGCAGVSIVIYNPDRDPDRVGAERIVRFAADLAAAAP